MVFQEVVDGLVVCGIFIEQLQVQCDLVKVSDEYYQFVDKCYCMGVDNYLILFDV